MKRRVLMSLPLVALLPALIWTVSRTHLEGDGYEYLLSARAFLSHATSIIRREDISAFTEIAEESPVGAEVGSSVLEEMAVAVSKGEKGPVAGLLRAKDGSYFTMHFWLYSLLLVPFLALAGALGASPVWAFGLLNLSCAIAAIAYLVRVYGSSARSFIAAWLFALGGTSFFIPWSGPEVMTASAVLISCVATARGSYGLGFFAAGIAASQNPSAACLFLAIVSIALARRLRPKGTPSLRVAGSISKRETLLAFAGLLLAALPPVYFQCVYGAPSAISELAIDIDLMTRERLFSFFFDLNQGMIAGAPGLIVGAIAASATALATGKDRKRCAIAISLTAALVIAMALPTLLLHNWNSGSRAAWRHAYWISMPLLALALYLLSSLGRRASIAVAASALCVQSLAVAMFGLAGRCDAQVSHNALAGFVLEHAPRLYNPSAEIFFERTAGEERELRLDEIVVYRSGGRPCKLMRHWLNEDASGGLCPAGRALDTAHATMVSGGWRYLDAPFRCIPAASSPRFFTWRPGSASLGGAGIFGDGWSRPERDGVWSDGTVSHLVLPRPAHARSLRLLWRGRYYRGSRDTFLRIDGKDLGTWDLEDAEIVLPESAERARELVIELRHEGAASPKSFGESDDARKLGLYLVALGLESAP